MRIEVRNNSAVFRELSTALLRRGTSVQFEARGVSMSPTIRSGDLVQVDPVGAGELRRGDVVLGQEARRSILHRIHALEANACVTRGDSARYSDRSMALNAIMGRVLKARRATSGRSIALDSQFANRMYAARAALYRGLRSIRDRFAPLASSLLILCLLLGSNFGFAGVTVDSSSSSGVEVP